MQTRIHLRATASGAKRRKSFTEASCRVGRYTSEMLADIDLIGSAVPTCVVCLSKIPSGPTQQTRGWLTPFVSHNTKSLLAESSGPLSIRLPINLTDQLPLNLEFSSRIMPSKVHCRWELYLASPNPSKASHSALRPNGSAVALSFSR